jgi:cell division transport system ATP-binding protein
MLIIKDVSFSYGKEPIFNGLNLKVEQGEFVYLIGKSGVGKSTLFNLIYMNILPQRGVVRFENFSSKTIKPNDIPFLRRKVGMIFQNPELLEDRNIYSNLEFVLRITDHKKKEIKKKILEALSDVGISHKQKSMPNELSGGELQRVAIARALLNEPKLLLADEPTGNLDPEITDEIMELLKRINRRGTAIIFATHDYELVKKHPAERILKIDKKKIFRVRLKQN